MRPLHLLGSLLERLSVRLVLPRIVAIVVIVVAAFHVGALERLLGACGALGLPLVLYEAPQRMRDLLRRLVERAPFAQVAVGRELTKRFEEVVAGSPAEVAGALTEPRGEYVLVVSGLDAPAGDGAAGRGLEPEVVARAAAGEGLSRRSVADLLRAAGMARREAYDLAGAVVPDDDRPVSDA